MDARGYAEDWPAIRQQILYRDRYACALCNAQDVVALATGDDVGLMHVHHFDRNKRNNDPSNLWTLCRRCHCNVHGLAWYPHRPGKRPRGRGRFRVRMKPIPLAESGTEPLDTALPNPIP